MSNIRHPQDSCKPASNGNSSPGFPPHFWDLYAQGVDEGIAQGFIKPGDEDISHYLYIESLQTQGFSKDEILRKANETFYPNTPAPRPEVTATPRQRLKYLLTAYPLDFDDLLKRQKLTQEEMDVLDKTYTVEEMLKGFLGLLGDISRYGYRTFGVYLRGRLDQEELLKMIANLKLPPEMGERGWATWWFKNRQPIYERGGEALYRLGCLLRFKGLGPTSLEGILQDINRKYCDPRIEEEEVISTAERAFYR